MPRRRTTLPKPITNVKCDICEVTYDAEKYGYVAFGIGKRHGYKFIGHVVCFNNAQRFAKHCAKYNIK